MKPRKLVVILCWNTETCQPMENEKKKKFQYEGKNGGNISKSRHFHSRYVKSFMIDTKRVSEHTTAGKSLR